MKVLKFGGTSVANSKSLLNVIDIVKESNDRKILVVSALGGITNLLDEMSTQASKGESNYKDKLQILENRHLDLIEFLFQLLDKVK
jgi:aspartokinase/homoserine dehydrogenase 1